MLEGPGVQGVLILIAGMALWAGLLLYAEKLEVGSWAWKIVVWASVICLVTGITVCFWPLLLFLLFG